jgi:indolepyruvate ferredoxin oxidoreductase
MVTRPDADPPEPLEFISRISSRTKTLDTIPAEALAEAVFGSSLLSNVILLGFACQLGAVPFRPESLEQAIADRGVAVEQNREALRLGRAVASDPTLAERILEDETPPGIVERQTPDRAASVLGEAWNRFEQTLGGPPECEMARNVLTQVSGLALDLADYQSRSYADRYLETLASSLRAERAVEPGSVEITITAARELYRLMAYKDEYEVARLLLRGPFRRWLERRSRGRLRLRYHLQPPFLRALGLRRKLAVGRWVEPALHALAGCRKLRGTRIDPFGRTAVRRLERELVGWYEQVLKTVAHRLTGDNLKQALEIASAATSIRGFEQIKQRRAAEVRARVTFMLEKL